MLEELNIANDAIIMVNNPPGFYLATGRKSIVIPNGDVDNLISTAKKYGAEILVLESNHPDDLDLLFEAPADLSGLQLLASTGDVHIFRIPVE
jgi:hypothetical protein